MYTIFEKLLFVILLFIREPNDEKRDMYISRYEECCRRTGKYYDPFSEKVYRLYQKVVFKKYNKELQMKTKCPFCGNSGAIGPISSPVEYRGGYLCGGCRSVHHVPEAEHKLGSGTIIKTEPGHHKSTDRLIENAKHGKRAIYQDS